MKNLTVFIILLAVSNSLSAQSRNQSWSPSDDALLDGRTMIKANLLGVATRNFGFYGERILAKRVSLVMGINTMPTGGIPFIEQFSDEPEIRDIQISSTAFTPEIRLYLSPSGYGRGFYIAPYYKYEGFHASAYSIEFEDEENNNQFINMNGNLNTHSFGVALGIQWILGKRNNIIIDWTMLGAHYGSNKGHLKGKTTYDMNEATQDEIRKTIEDGFSSIEIGNIFQVKTDNIIIDSNNAQVDIESPWAFIRASLSIGFRF